MPCRPPSRRSLPRLRPASAPGAVIAITAVLLAWAVLASPGAEAADARPASTVIVDTARPGFALQGVRWDRQEVLVYANWTGGRCIINGNDVSSPASSIPTAVLDATLQASLAEINGHLRGGLTLRFAGNVTRASLCNASEALPIVVGFANAQSTGSTLIFGTRPANGMGTLAVARVLINPTGWTQVCPDEPAYRDLRHVMTHELLHAIGVDHSAVPSALMLPTFTSCDTPYLMQPDDVAAVNALYTPVLPATSSTATPTPTATPVPPPSGRFASPVRYSTAGQSLAVFSGGSVGQLEAAARAEGARGAWVQDAIGRFRLLVVDGPPFLRQEFSSAFPAGLWSNVAVTLVR